MLNLLLKVLLLMIAIIMTTNLRKKFTLDGITFCTCKHPLPYYNYVHLIFDAQFGNKLIDYDDLIDEGIIVDQSDYKQVNDDAVDCLRNFITEECS